MGNSRNDQSQLCDVFIEHYTKSSKYKKLVAQIHSSELDVYAWLSEQETESITSPLESPDQGTNGR